LRIGYAGGNAALTNIDRDGFASAAFHSYPDTLKWDAYSGDYGMNFFGYAMNAATYVADMNEFGWQAFGGNIRVNGDRVVVTPLDSMRRRVFIAPLGLWLNLDAGSFSSIEIDKKKRTVSVVLSPATPNVIEARLRVEQTAKLKSFAPERSHKTERGAWVIKLRAVVTKIELTEE
jgi:hypothetical protein